MVTTAFEPVELAAIEPDVKRHLAGLPSAINSFLEAHIIESTNYRMIVDQAPAGFASIHQETLITQFAVSPPFRRHGQALFLAVRRLEQARSAFVPTCDEPNLSHALDGHRSVGLQAYFFTALDGEAGTAAGAEYAIQPAAIGDIGFIRAETGDFFEPVERYLAKDELYLTLRGETRAGFGLMVRSALYDDVASIGMFTPPHRRWQGVGTATISLLRDECRRRGLRPVAGCWYFNHRSKRTLEAAGLYLPSRLLRIDY